MDGKKLAWRWEFSQLHQFFLAQQIDFPYNIVHLNERTQFQEETMKKLGKTDEEEQQMKKMAKRKQGKEKIKLGSFEKKLRKMNCEQIPNF